MRRMQLQLGKYLNICLETEKTKKTRVDMIDRRTSRMRTDC
jgi:hypothetical protein